MLIELLSSTYTQQTLKKFNSKNKNNTLQDYFLM